MTSDQTEAFARILFREFTIERRITGAQAYSRQNMITCSAQPYREGPGAYLVICFSRGID